MATVLNAYLTEKYEDFTKDPLKSRGIMCLFNPSASVFDNLDGSRIR